jgi:hypothetical protein
MRSYCHIRIAILSSALWATLAPASQDDEWQFWNTDAVRVKLREGLKAKAEVETHWDDGMRNLSTRYEDIALEWGARPWLDLLVAYREVQSWSDGTRYGEHRPRAGATLKGEWEKFDFSNRNRIEYRIREDAPDGWRYRNLLRIVAPPILEGGHVRPYLEDEVFYDFNDSRISENRLAAGLTFRLWDRLSCDLCYRWQEQQKSDDWQTAHVFGTGFTLDI